MAVGCVGEAELDELTEGAPQHAAVYLADEEDQGVYLLGAFADTLETVPLLGTGRHFRVSEVPDNHPAMRLSVTAAGAGGVNGTHLVADDGTKPDDHVGADPWFIGVILNGTGGQLRIRGVATTGTTVLSTIYFLDYRSTAGGNIGPWGDYCGGEGGGAIPLSGYYDSRRIHQSGPYITFACEDGVGFKCNAWGYPAGIGGPGHPNWDHHQACTAMANADYCRKGVPFTREQTPVMIRDFSTIHANPYPSDLGHPAPFPGDPDRFYFEAAWRPGALAPVCLSRHRWASLPPEPCPGTLEDPRYSDDKSAKFCEDMSLADIQSLGALVVNGSKMMDAPLHRWRNPSTGDVVQTIRGFYIDKDGASGPDPTSTIPFPGYTDYLGADSMLLRNLPGTLSTADMYRLYLQENPVTQERVIAHGVLPNHVIVDFEGYSFLDPYELDDLVPLRLHWCTGSDYRATAGSPYGCTAVSSLKYVLPPP